MSSVFKSPKSPKVAEIPEEVAVVSETEGDVAAQKKKKKVLTGGRRGTIISGISTALKERLGK